MSRHVAAAICFVFSFNLFRVLLSVRGCVGEVKIFYEVVLSSDLKDISLLTALLPVEHVHDDRDVAATKVNIHLWTRVLAWTGH